jgi:hypothetical protein
VNARTTKMDSTAVRARAAQAKAFLDAARLQFGDSAAGNSVAGTAAVHAGIAAADAICGKTLGYRARGESHEEAVDLPMRAIPDAKPSKNLARLLGQKSLAGYSPVMLSDVRTAELIKFAQRLVDSMEAILG